MGERHICAKYNRLVCPQLGDHSRRARKTSYGASECTQGEEVEEGECGEPAIGLEYRAVEKFHDIIRAIQVIFKYIKIYLNL